MGGGCGLGFGNYILPSNARYINGNNYICHDHYFSLLSIYRKIRKNRKERENTKKIKNPIRKSQKIYSKKNITKCSGNNIRLVEKDQNIQN